MTATYPFPFLGAGPGRASDVWRVFVLFREEPGPEARATLAQSVPEIVADQVVWESRLLACASAPDVEYAVRLGTIARKARRGAGAGELRALVEAAYAADADAPRSPKMKHWTPTCRALDEWITALHARQPIACCARDNLDAAGPWHAWSLSCVRTVFLPELIGVAQAVEPAPHWPATNDEPRWRVGAALTAVAAAAVDARAARDAGYVREVGEALERVFGLGDVRAVANAGLAWADWLRAAPAAARGELVAGGLVAQPRVTLLALGHPVLAALLEDAALRARAQAALEQAGPARRWLVATLGDRVARELEKARRKEPPAAGLDALQALLAVAR